VLAVRCYPGYYEGMGDRERAQGETEAARRAREDMRAATDRLRARIVALRRLRREPEARPGEGRGAGAAPER
jgi:hypothetical protein